MKHGWKKILGPAPLAFLLIMGTAVAAVTLSYTTASSQSLGVTPPPVIFQSGADSGASNYVSGFTTSSNATRFSVTLSGVPEATLTIGELVKVKNQDTAAHTVTLTSTQVVNSKILVYKLEFYNGAALVSTLDFLAASPSADLGSIAAGAAYTAKAIIKLDTGAGNHNVANIQRDISMTVSA